MLWEPFAMDVERLSQPERLQAAVDMRRQLKAGANPTRWHSAEAQADGVIALGWPKYERWLSEGLYSAVVYLEHARGFDRDAAMRRYGELLHSEAVHNDNPRTLEALWAELTYVLRGERFCDGHIDAHIKNGRLPRLMDVFAQLV